MTFLSIPTALLSNKSKAKSILAHINIAPSNSTEQHQETVPSDVRRQLQRLKLSRA
jgi:hypothetical protein